MSKLTFLNQEFDIDMSIIQMEIVASDLASLLKHSGFSRVELAEKLDCPKSRVTRILSGDENLTIKTITQVAEALGYAYDVVFYNKNYARPKQPWQVDRENRKLAQSLQNVQPNRHLNFRLQLQSGEQVVQDVLSGVEASQYIKIDSYPNSNDDNKQQMVIERKRPIISFNQQTIIPTRILSQREIQHG